MEDNVFEFKVATEDTTTENEAGTVNELENSTVNETENETTEDNSTDFNPLDYLQNQVDTTSVSEEKAEVAEEVNPSITEKKEVKNDAYTWAEKNNRSPEDYFKLHKDWKNESDELALRTYLKEKYPYYSDQEIEDEINDNFGFEEFDEDTIKSRKTREYKKEIETAKKYLSDNFGETTAKNDVEVTDIPQEYQQAFEILEQQKEFQKQGEKARATYIQELENNYKDFKGFDFSFDVIDQNGAKQDVSLTYAPTKENLQRTIDVQKDTNKLLEKHLEISEDGNVSFKDSKEFFRTIAFATNMNEVLRMAYEQGASSATENLVKNDLKKVNHTNPDKHNSSATGIKFSVE